MCHSVNLSLKIVDQNAGCVFPYFCDGHKSNFRLPICSSFNTEFQLSLEIVKIRNTIS